MNISALKQEKQELFAKILEAGEFYGLHCRAKLVGKTTAYYYANFRIVSFIFWQMLEYLKNFLCAGKIKIIQRGGWEKFKNGRCLFCQVEFKENLFKLFFYYDKRKATIKIL